MRELKFRGICINSNKWLIGNGCVFDESNDIYQITHKQGINLMHHSEIIKETLGQYTGLKDRNGKEIYEGDICMGVYTTDYYSVKFMDGYFCITDKNGMYEEILVDITSDIEVIGNIYENPELLNHDK